MGRKHVRGILFRAKDMLTLWVDFKLLRKQKRALVEIKCPSDEVLGLLEFLDAFQDAAAKIHGDKVVFGKDA